MTDRIEEIRGRLAAARSSPPIEPSVIGAGARVDLQFLLSLHDSDQKRIGELERERDDYKADYFRVHKDSVDRYERIVVLQAAAEGMATALVNVRELIHDADPHSIGLEWIDAALLPYRAIAQKGE